MEMENNPGIQKIDRRTKAGKAAAELQAGLGDAPQRSSNRQQTREAVRDMPRTTRGKIQVRGRDGEILSRKRTSSGDIFAVPAELIDPGWEMQWIAVSVVGNTEIVMDQNLQMMENGWKSVDASRFPGRFMPEGYKGAIIRGGQGLYERPKVLCDEARAEDIRTARQLISDRNESLKLQDVKTNMPDGFEMSGKYRGSGGEIRMSIDKGLDIAQPSHTLAEPE